MLNQDPWWRSRVLPLFKFDPKHPKLRPVGLGTTFRVDPFGTAATAFHVIEEFFETDGENLKLSAAQALVALDMPEGAISFGLAPILQDWWRPLVSIVARPVALKTSPLIHEPCTVANFSEIVSLGFLPLIDNAAPYLPVRLRGALPTTGDVLTAYGYANLDQGGVEDDPLSQYLYSFAGRVVEVVPADISSSRPWPKATVKAHWPPGMSGGPVLNAAEEVVGIVSTSFDGAEFSTAHIFAGWNVPQITFPTLDPNNPGWFPGFAAIDSADNLRFFGHDRLEAEEFANSNGHRMQAVSSKLATGEWVSVNVRN